MNRSKSNRSLRKSHQGRFKEHQETFIHEHGPLKFKEVSEEELQQIKQEIRQKAKKDRLKNLIIAIVTLLLITVGVIIALT